MKVLIVIYLITVPSVFAKDSDMEKVVIGLDQLHPTQFVIGEDVIPIKTAKIERLHKKGYLADYLEDKVTPAVLGPDGFYYILDHHHLSRALYEANIPMTMKKIFIKIKKKKFDKSTFEKFYYYMLNKEFVYLKITGKVSRSIDELPGHVKDLTNDPYRSLAWMIRERGAYKKRTVPFLEFEWGNYLYKQGVKIPKGEITEEIILEAIELAKSKNASHLPGYKK